MFTPESQISNQDYEGKIKETFRRLGVDWGICKSNYEECNG